MISQRRSGNGVQSTLSTLLRLTSPTALNTSSAEQVHFYPISISPHVSVESLLSSLSHWLSGPFAHLLLAHVCRRPPRLPPPSHTPPTRLPPATDAHIPLITPLAFPPCRLAALSPAPCSCPYALTSCSQVLIDSRRTLGHEAAVAVRRALTARAVRRQPWAGCSVAGAPLRSWAAACRG